jgi:hypothetical protein
MTARQAVIAWAVVGVILALISIHNLGCSSSPAARYVCSPQGDEKCPDPADYAFIRGYVDKYKPPVPPREESDRATGAWQRMAMACGSGYRLDQVKIVCVKIQAPVMTPVAPPTK